MTVEDELVALGFRRLFEPLTIGNFTVRNRIVNTTHGTGLSDANDAVNTAMDAMATGGEAVGNAIEDAGNAVEDGISDAADAIEDLF